ncbi:C-type lectin domain family 17, member A-like [Eublepharis macularius]|uniref:C-type lectin domain family 17, member A-like n=1 Tax=Eublepharis macularius TaxID=481883 RepID=A0AA97KXD4_EUBMA|nr:C-type lectin domain family 17, member A-like [Eublepharis macularius]
METSYIKWDNSEQVNVLMEGQKKAQEKGFHIHIIKRKIVIYCVILGIGFLFIIALLSQSLRNESEMSKAIKMSLLGKSSDSSSSQMTLNLSKEIAGIGQKVVLLQELPYLQKSAGDLMTTGNLTLSMVKKLDEQTLSVLAELGRKNDRDPKDVIQELEKLQNLTAAQMRKENLIPSLLEEVAKLREENRRIAEDATKVLEELHNLTEHFCTKCPPNWASFEKNCYFFSTLSAPWTAAKQSCENEGAHLVIINNRPELKFLVNLIMTDRVFWMGLSDAGQEGQWIWVDGTPLTFSSWGKGEPNNAGHGEDCATLHSNGNWNDAFCSGNELWICEQKC